MRLEFDGPLGGCSSRETFTKTADCRPIVNRADPFESRHTEKGFVAPVDSNLRFHSHVPNFGTRIFVAECACGTWSGHGRDMVGTSDCLAETTLATRGKKVPFQKKTFFRAASRQSSFRETV